jgi:vesicle coat complex subunit
LVRALAVRTMGCLRVKGLNSYLIDPLMNALRDTDPYVKKTAVMAVPKFYELTPELIEQHKIIEEVQGILNKDTNSVVIANTVITLAELSQLRGENLVNINEKNLDKILESLSECMGKLF